MYRIHNLIYFPPNVLTHSPFPTFFSRSYDPINYVIPFVELWRIKILSFLPQLNYGIHHMLI